MGARRVFDRWAPGLQVLAGACLAAAACGANASELGGGRSGVLPWGDGLTSEDRKILYHTAEGAEGLPLAWMQALVSSRTGKPFFEQPERFGLHADPDDPYGLPIGFAVSVPRDLAAARLQMTGINCGACHVGEVRYKGKAMRFVGGPSFFNAHSLQVDLVKSLEETAKNPKRLFRFIARAADHARQNMAKSLISEEHDEVLRKYAPALADAEKGSGEDALLDRVTAHLASGGAAPSDDEIRPFVARFTSAAAKKEKPQKVLKEIGQAVNAAFRTARMLVERAKLLKFNSDLGNAAVTDAGAGRVDAFGTLMYRVYKGKGAHPPNAPVSFPQLYNIATTTWYHYDGNTSTITERNIGNAIGLGVIWDPKTMETTLLPRGVHAMEAVFWKARPPKWPAAILGAIDEKKRARGEKVFQSECASCHVDKVNQLTSAAGLGTDPKRFDVYHFDVRSEGKRENALIAMTHLLKKLVKKAYKQERLTKAEVAAMTLGRPDGTWDVKGRKGMIRIPKLTSVWSTAPYLHNGSVPSLEALLTPATARPNKFYLGGYDFDPTKVGYETKGTEPWAWEFDTRQAGNSNGGHEFGTKLPADDRQALIEYLKSL